MCVVYYRMNIVGLVPVVQNQAYFPEWFCKVNFAALIWDDKTKLLK